MSVESIIEHILSKARQDADQIIQQAKQEADQLTEQAKQEAAELYQEMMAKEKTACEKQRQVAIVEARLANRNGNLHAKQEIIDALFKTLQANINKDSFKKQQVSWDKVQVAAEDAQFLMSRIRLEYETEIAGILFG